MDETEYDRLQLEDEADEFSLNLYKAQLTHDRDMQFRDPTKKRPSKDRGGKKVERKCIECTRSFQVPAGNQTEFVFCPTCSKKKCLRCGMVLSHKHKCAECHVAHGKPSEERPNQYCVTCINYVPTDTLPTTKTNLYDRRIKTNP